MNEPPYYPPPYYVIECSQVHDRRGFWALYMETLAHTESSLPEWNLASFRDAVVSAGPGYPGACFIEVRNRRNLAHHEPEFVDALFQIEAELKERDQPVQLVLPKVGEGQRPRGGLYQHECFVSRELMGERVLRVLCWGETKGSTDMLLLECNDGIWQRLFLEYGVTFWSEVGAADAFAGYEDIVDEFVDLTEQLGSEELIVGTIEARTGAESSVEVSFDSGARLRLEPVDRTSVEADVRLIVTAGCGR